MSEKVRRRGEAACRRGPATLSARHDGGFFVEPTIFGDVDPYMSIAQEEIFGPILSELQSGSPTTSAMALAATVWTNSLDRALRFAERLQVGIIWTNSHSLGPHIPWEAHKESGLGETGGLEAFGTLTRLKTKHISVTRAPIEW